MVGSLGGFSDGLLFLWVILFFFLCLECVFSPSSFRPPSLSLVLLIVCFFVFFSLYFGSLNRKALIYQMEMKKLVSEGNHHGDV